MSEENEVLDGQNQQEIIPDVNTPNYAYVDRSGTLHLVGDMETAIQYVAPGKNVISTMIPEAEGYPVINGSIVIVENGVAYVNGNSSNGHLIATPFELVSLLNQIG